MGKMEGGYCRFLFRTSQIPLALGYRLRQKDPTTLLLGQLGLREEEQLGLRLREKDPLFHALFNAGKNLPLRPPTTYYSYTYRYN